MKQLLSPHVALVVACTLLGCTTPKRTTRPVREIRIDTLYMSNRQFDSIYIVRDRTTDYRRAVRSPTSSGSSDQLFGSCSLPLGSYDLTGGLCNQPSGSCSLPSALNHQPPDTLVIRETLTEYRYHLLHDTVRIHQVDTVPVIHEVAVIQEVARPLTRFDRLTRTTFWIVISLLAACLLRFIRRNIPQIIPRMLSQIKSRLFS